VKNVLSCIILAITSLAGFGQDMSIMGKVTDENGKPVANVHIIADGNLGEAISENSGYYRLAFLSAVKPGQGVTLRIEDKRFELFTLGIVAGNQLKDISLVHKKKDNINARSKDSAADGSKTVQTITLDHPTFNAPAQVGNNNTQINNFSRLEYIAPSEDIQEWVDRNLRLLKMKYNATVPILVIAEQGNAVAAQTAKTLGNLLSRAQLGGYSSQISMGFDPGRPFSIACRDEDSTFAKNLMTAISPYLNSNYHRVTSFLPRIELHLEGTPYFDSNGAVIIK
jgi:hypothetical protein